MKNNVGKFTFKVPEGHADAGKKIEKPFEYGICENDSEALNFVAKKISEAKSEDAKAGWTLMAMVNDVIKSNARSNAYQAALLPYRPSEVSPEEIKERMVRDYIRLGIPEDMARKQVESLLAAMPQATTDEVVENPESTE